MALCCGVGTQGVPRATQNHNMGVFMKRIKIKMIRFYHRCKNKIVYAYKRVRVPFVAFLMCFSLLACTLFACKQTAYATGVEEMLYYTYWDLVSGLFSEVGYQYSVKDEYYTSPKRASGEQIWDNFCTWVENKAKALSLPVAVVHDELKNLPNVVTEAGVNMSEKLAEILAKVLPTAANETASGGNFFDDSSFENYAAVIAGICGTAASVVPHYGHFGKSKAYNGNVGEAHSYLLNIVAYDRYYYIFEDNYYFDSEFAKGGLNILGSDLSRSVQPCICFDTVSKYYTKSVIISPYPDSGYTWIMRNGQIASADGIAQSDYARVKVKEKTEDQDGVYIPGVGWKTKWEIWDDVLNNSDLTQEEKEEWWLRYHVNELLKDVPDSSHVDPDDEKRRKENNKKDRLPVVIPIVLPHKKDDKEDTEDSTEESTEKDTEGVVVPIPTPDSTEDSSEDSTQDSTQDEDYEDVVDSAEKGGNWKRLFPFCIPWDIMTLVQSMNAEKKAPHFKFKHRFEMINYTFQFDVDMSKYWKYIKIFRWGMTIFFIIGLFFLTVKFTTFVHRGN